MKILNRIFTSVSAVVDRAVTHVENHEAIVAAALKETRMAAAKAKVQYSRVAKDGSMLRNKLEKLMEMEKTWENRAAKTAKENKNKALECIQRRNQCQASIAQAQQALQTHEKLEENIAKSIQKIENRIEELTQQRNMMRSRHSTADAMKIVNQIENESGYFVDNALDRWETVITETEYMTDNVIDHDELHDNFTQIEDEASLASDLEELLAKEKGGKS